MFDMGITDSIPRLICCQTENANPFFKSFSKAMKEERDMRFDDYEAIEAQALPDDPFSQTYHGEKQSFRVLL
jgi:hypothetical protein